MEEDKAARYYDELVRKGENAAKFKQGLGFGTRTTSVLNSEAYSSLSNFVKEASPGRAAILGKETIIDSVRDKLQKREEYSSREYHSSRQWYPDDDGKKSSDNKTAEERARVNTLEDCESEDGKRKKSGYRRPSSSPERTERGRPRRCHSRSNDRKISRSPSGDGGKAEGQSAPGVSQLIRKKRETPGRSSRSLSSDHSTRLSERRNRSKRSSRDRNLSYVDGCRSRHRSKNFLNRGCSPSRSCEGRRWDRSPSRSRGEYSDRRRGYRRERAYSPYESHERGRNRSPFSHRGYYNNHRDTSSTGPDNRHVDSSKRSNADDRREQRLSGRQRQRDGITEAAAHSRDSRAKENPSKRDYSKLIPNFHLMTPAEKVKAKMKLQLSEIGLLHEDQASGVFNEWERFDFDKNAPLDDDAKLDYFGDGTGASDDSLFLKNTGSTYLSSSNQVKREDLMTAAHEAAIFGPPQGLTLKTEREAIAGKKGGSHPSESGIIDRSIIMEVKDTEISTPPLNSVVSDQVIVMQQGTSWQERALKLRESRDAALFS